MPDKELDELLEQLKTKPMNPVHVKENNSPIDDQNINDYILNKTKDLVDDGVDAVQALKTALLTSGERDDVSAYSDMFKAVVGALDTLTKINIQNKKSKTSIELKQIEIAGINKTHLSGNTNIVIATREEIMEQFIKKGSKTIEAVFEEPNELDEKD